MVQVWRCRYRRQRLYVSDTFERSTVASASRLRIYKDALPAATSHNISLPNPTSARIPLPMSIRIWLGPTQLSSEACAAPDCSFAMPKISCLRRCNSPRAGKVTLVKACFCRFHLSIFYYRRSSITVPLQHIVAFLFILSYFTRMILSAFVLLCLSFHAEAAPAAAPSRNTALARRQVDTQYLRTRAARDQRSTSRLATGSPVVALYKDLSPYVVSTALEGVYTSC